MLFLTIPPLKLIFSNLNFFKSILFIKFHPLLKFFPLLSQTDRAYRQKLRSANFEIFKIVSAILNMFVTFQSWWLYSEINL